MITLLATILVLGVLIFVHELGHFATAKWANIAVPRFSIGLGPKAFGFQRGETEYIVSWIPLGGYVRMAGMDDMEALEGGAEDSTEARASGRDFESKSLPVRALVISAGVIMNMLFAWLVFAGIAMVWGVREAPPPVVGDVIEELVPPGAAALLDIPPGARIAAIDGAAVEDWSDIDRGLAMIGDSVSIRLEDGRVLTVAAPESDSARAALRASLRPALTIAARIGAIEAGSPADSAGLRPGDVVIEAGGDPVGEWAEFVRVIEASPAEPIRIVVQREQERVPLTIVPGTSDVPADPGRAVGRIGVAAAEGPLDALPRERLGPLDALAHGAERTWTITVMILEYLGGLFTGDASPRDVGGPILIYQISDQMVEVGLDALLDFMALFSINLAILNLLPIPILDGGQLLFLAIEGIRGRPLSVDQRVRLSQVGLVLIVAIMVWAVANDVLRLFGL